MKEAAKQNFRTRKIALDYLNDDGAIGVFPGDAVSTSLKPFSHPMDPSLRSFTAKLIAKSGASVVPLFFKGYNSRLFHITSHLNYNLRMALMIQEFKKRVDEPVRIVVSELLLNPELKHFEGKPRKMMEYLLQRMRFSRQPYLIILILNPILP